MRRGLLAVIAALLMIGPVHAEDRVPYGAVVKDGNGDLWVVLDSQRYRLPVYPLDPADTEIIAASDQWVVPSSRDGWTLGARPEWAGGPSPLTAPPVAPTATTAPVASAEAPITFEGGRIKNTDPFTLVGGNYKFRWTASGENGRGCFHGAQLMPVQRGGYTAGAGSGTVEGNTTSGETAAYNVPAGSYYLDVGSGCAKWKITIQPL